MKVIRDSQDFRFRNRRERSLVAEHRTALLRIADFRLSCGCVTVLERFCGMVLRNGLSVSG